MVRVLDECQKHSSRHLGGLIPPLLPAVVAFYCNYWIYEMSHSGHKILVVFSIFLFTVKIDVFLSIKQHGFF